MVLLMQKRVRQQLSMFQAYVVSIVRPYYQYLVGVNASSVTHQTALARTAFVQWACELGISECETYTNNAFIAWYNNCLLYTSRCV